MYGPALSPVTHGVCHPAHPLIPVTSDCISPTASHHAVLRQADNYVYWFESSTSTIVKSENSTGHLPSVAVTGVEGVTDFVVTLSHYSPS